MFTTQYGGPLSATTWQERHKRIIAEHALPAITLHGLRHSVATLALEMDVHPRIVQDILGHASIQTTMDRYSHVSTRLQATAANALDSALFGPVGTADGTRGAKTPQ